MRYVLTSAIVMLALLSFGACTKKTEPASGASPTVQGIKTETVAAQSMSAVYEAVGTIRAKNSSVVSSKVLGTITAMRVREGDTVQAGQVLAEIDNREALIQAQRSTAELAEARGALDEIERNIKAAGAKRAAAEANRRLTASTLRRYEQLIVTKSVSSQELDEVRTRNEVAIAEVDAAGRMQQSLEAKRRQVLARIDQAKANVASAQVNASFDRIVAPISGVVVSRQAEVGYMATPGAPLLTIENGADYRLEAAVQESQINQIHLGDRVGVQIDALGSQELAGFVAEIVPTADATSRSYLVKIGIALPAGDQLIRSGLYGKARFVMGQTEAITIPRQSLVERGQLTSVYVVDQSGLAHTRLVQTGKTYGDRVEVLSGLTAGEQIVTGDVTALTDGSRVREAAPGTPSTPK